MPTYDVRCSECGSRATASMQRAGIRGSYRQPLPRVIAKRVTCVRCGSIRESETADGVPFELWFKAGFRGGRTIWFRDERHGEALLAWLEGDRERRSAPGPERAWLETLPKWMLDAKNRSEVSSVVRRLLEDARQQPIAADSRDGRRSAPPSRACS